MIKIIKSIKSPIISNVESTEEAFGFGKNITDS